MSTKLFYLLSGFVFCLVNQNNVLASPAPSRSIEEEVALLAKKLKSIPDAQWKTIAGERVGERYEIVKGDTLSDISKRLFGDHKYWPKVWALNNDSITNPHVIRPGNRVSFLPGTGTTLPALAIEPLAGESKDLSEGPKIAAADSEQDPVRSDEWKYLSRQSWENVNVQLPPEVDAHGFDVRNKISFRQFLGFELESVVSSTPIELLGQITGSPSEASNLTMGDVVYIEAEGDLQVGETYALTQDATELSTDKNDREGYVYPIIGKVKIKGIRDNIFLGTISGNRNFVPRDTKLIPLPQTIRSVAPLAGPSPLEGTLITDKTNSLTSNTSQHKLVFIDLGSDDGVGVGMVLRAYQHRDPVTKKKITESNFIISADIMVVQVTEKFSTGVVIYSPNILADQSPVVVLTDVSSLKKRGEAYEKTTDERVKDTELDKLDKSDSSTGLGHEEEKDLQDLEQSQQKDESLDEEKNEEEEELDALEAPKPDAETPTTEAPINAAEPTTSASPAPDALAEEAEAPVSDAPAPTTSPEPTTPTAPEATPPAETATPEAPPTGDVIPNELDTVQ